jgi:hypothetical protein
VSHLPAPSFSQTLIMVDSGEWRKAFISCRKHRIDLAVLVIHSENFIDQIPSFVEQVNDVDFFGLFLTTISFVVPLWDRVSNLMGYIPDARHSHKTL